MKGPRFAYPQKQTACERCVWGTGGHSSDCVIRESATAAVRSGALDDCYDIIDPSNVANDPDDHGDRDRGATAVHGQAGQQEAS